DYFCQSANGNFNWVF
nr:immunoglobulin light chain junction region [Macaca mulatta]